jgi:deltex-like protein
MGSETVALAPKSPFRETKEETQVRSGAHTLSRRLWELSFETDGFQLAITDQDAFRWLAEGFLHKKYRLEAEGKYSDIDVGYHYTPQEEYVPYIQQCGLKVMGNREFFGPGIYTANNPHAFRSYGNVGLIVLVLKGLHQHVVGNEEKRSVRTDSVLGNKFQREREALGDPNRSQYFDEIVLLSHDQVLPLLQYDRDLTNNADLLRRVHDAVLEFVDHQFPSQYNAQRRHKLPTIEDLKYGHRVACSFKCALPSTSPLLVAMFESSSRVNALAAAAERARNLMDSVEFSRPSRRPRQFSMMLFVPSTVVSSEDCPICIEDLAFRSDVVRIVKCGHHYHKACLEQALAVCNKCPTCRAVLGEPTGTCPFGRMKIISSTSMQCGGFEDVGTIELEYRIYSGIQSSEHENPGHPFKGTSRTAYVPCNRQGKDLVKRLRYAFRRGLTFHIGTSLTSGISGVVCWASIHHKTSIDGGCHGWPDPSYFDNCNEELDRLAVPKASEL